MDNLAICITSLYRVRVDDGKSKKEINVCAASIIQCIMYLDSIGVKENQIESLSLVNSHVYYDSHRKQENDQTTD